MDPRKFDGGLITLAGQTSIRWKTDASLSEIHAAHIVATGVPCNDKKTVQALASPVTEINNRLLSSSLDIATFWQRLMSETLFQTPIKQAAVIALSDAGCSELQVEQLASVIVNRLSESRMAFQSRFPKLTEQLELRGRPLRDQWETYGPGLLAAIAKQIWIDSPPSDWWPKRVEAVLVQPMRGGDGDYDAESNRIWIEAVLTDVDPAVPEVLRLAYLITQLAIDTHTLERSTNSVTSLPWSVGMIPITLAAGADLGFVHSSPQSVATAMRLWGIGQSRSAEIVNQWWNQQQKAPAPMPLALKQLGQQLEKIPSPPQVETGIDLTQFD